jgi:hypothetical protein
LPFAIACLRTKGAFRLSPTCRPAERLIASGTFQCVSIYHA